MEELSLENNTKEELINLYKILVEFNKFLDTEIKTAENLEVNN